MFIQNEWKQAFKKYDKGIGCETLENENLAVKHY